MAFQARDRGGRVAEIGLARRPPRHAATGHHRRRPGPPPQPRRPGPNGGGGVGVGRFPAWTHPHPPVRRHVRSGQRSRFDGLDCFSDKPAVPRSCSRTPGHAESVPHPRSGRGLPRPGQPPPPCWGPWTSSGAGPSPASITPGTAGQVPPGQYADGQRQSRDLTSSVRLGPLELAEVVRSNVERLSDAQNVVVELYDPPYCFWSFRYLL